MLKLFHLIFWIGAIKQINTVEIFNILGSLGSFPSNTHNVIFYLKVNLLLSIVLGLMTVFGSIDFATLSVRSGLLELGGKLCC